MDTELTFVSAQAIVDLHEDLLALFGGPAGHDYAKVCSIAAYPLQKLAYANPPPSIPALAAHYAFATAKFHAFTDGNKRLALALMDLFLIQNEYELISKSDDNVEAILALASGEIGDQDWLQWVSDNCVHR